jgi:hypothetical protein
MLFKSNCRLVIVAIGSAMIGLTGAHAQSPRIDGEFDEWINVVPIATDPIGDAKAAFDISSLSAISDGNTLYLELTLEQPLNLQSGMDEEGDLKLAIEANGKSLVVDFRKRKVSYGDQHHLGWSATSFQCLPTFAAKRFEMQIDLASIEAKPGDNVSIQFSGSDELAQPAAVLLQPGRPKLPIAYYWGKPAGALRVVNQNTLQNGLADPERGPKFKRLFQAVDGDVFCFQEEWKKEDFVTGVAKTLGCTNRPLHVHYSGGCAIATCLKLNSLPMKLDRAAAGLITMDDGEPWS